MYASAGQLARQVWAGRRAVHNSNKTGAELFRVQKKPRRVQEGVLTAGQGSSALALGGRLSAPDNPTRQIISVKQSSRRVAPRHLFESGILWTKSLCCLAMRGDGRRTRISLMFRPGESYSDVILRLAEASALPPQDQDV